MKKVMSAIVKGCKKSVDHLITNVQANDLEEVIQQTGILLSFSMQAGLTGLAYETTGTCEVMMVLVKSKCKPANWHGRVFARFASCVSCYICARH